MPPLRERLRRAAATCKEVVRRVRRLRSGDASSASESNNSPTANGDSGAEYQNLGGNGDEEGGNQPLVPLIGQMLSWVDLIAPESNFLPSKKSKETISYNILWYFQAIFAAVALIAFCNSYFLFRFRRTNSMGRFLLGIGYIASCVTLAAALGIRFEDKVNLVVSLVCCVACVPSVILYAMR